MYISGIHDKGTPCWCYECAYDIAWLRFSSISSPSCGMTSNNTLLFIHTYHTCLRISLSSYYECMCIRSICCMTRIAGAQQRTPVPVTKYAPGKYIYHRIGIRSLVYRREQQNSSSSECSSAAFKPANSSNERNIQKYKTAAAAAAASATTPSNSS